MRQYMRIGTEASGKRLTRAYRAYKKYMKNIENMKSYKAKNKKADNIDEAYGNLRKARSIKYSRNTYMGINAGQEVSRVKQKRTKSVRDIRAQFARIEANSDDARTERARKIAQSYVNNIQNSKSWKKMRGSNIAYGKQELMDALNRGMKANERQYSRNTYMGLSNG